MDVDGAFVEVLSSDGEHEYRHVVAGAGEHIEVHGRMFPDQLHGGDSQEHAYSTRVSLTVSSDTVRTAEEDSTTFSTSRREYRYSVCVYVSLSFLTISLCLFVY